MFKVFTRHNKGILGAGNGVVPQMIRVKTSIGNLNTSHKMGVRFNSTKTEITHQLSQISEIPREITSLHSDQLGYLHSIGLADGYGPTALIEKVLEYTHVYSGLPWWATIAAVTIGIRVVMFPLYVRASENGAKMAKVKPQLDKIMKDLRQAETPQDQVRLTHERRKLMKDNDIHMSRQFLPLVQMPIAYGFFQALRKMAEYPVEGFADQGIAWIQDLSQVDPYLGLQALTGVIVLAMFRLGGETGAMQVNPAFKKVMYAIPLVLILVTKNFYASVVLYFAINSAFSLLQTIILRNKTIRKIAGIPIMPKPTVNTLQQNLGQWWSELQETTRQNTRKRMEKSNKKLEALEKRRQNVNSNFVKKH